jgi:hypothetical protein
MPDFAAEFLEVLGLSPARIARDMGTMPARGQIAVSSQARYLDGVRGSAFVHTMLLAEYSIVIECFSVFSDRIWQLQ